MPRRAAPGHRDRLEAALTPSLLDALVELREILDIVDWRQTPLAPGFQAAAVLAMAADLSRDGLAPSAALEHAAAHLHLEPDTIKTWCRRWPAASRVHYEPAAGGSTAVRLICGAAEALPGPDDDEAA